MNDYREFLLHLLKTISEDSCHDSCVNDVAKMINAYLTESTLVDDDLESTLKVYKPMEIE